MAGDEGQAISVLNKGESQAYGILAGPETNFKAGQRHCSVGQACPERVFFVCFSTYSILFPSFCSQYFQEMIKS